MEKLRPEPSEEEAQKPEELFPGNPQYSEDIAKIIAWHQSAAGQAVNEQLSEDYTPPPEDPE